MQEGKKPVLSFSLDLDNTWSYLKIHGDDDWERAPSHFPIFVPIYIDFMKKHQIQTTIFIVGRDAANKENEVWFRKLVASGHDVGNHSFHHEPWMQTYDEQRIIDELKQAHQSIKEATGLEPLGFRGPGFCQSTQLLEAISKIGYRYDTSLLATIIGPIARFYYLLGTKKFSEEEKAKREVLFGSFANAFRPNSPFYWKTTQGKLLEIPVTTMPLFRTPIHLSYLIWLAQFSDSIAWIYSKMWISLTKQLNVSPSILLHPPDFMGKEDLPALSFFPGMRFTREAKLQFIDSVFKELKNHFDLISLNEYVKMVESHPDKLKEINLQGSL
jgi:hypothetical protein